jgi:GH15 family glucan-1,4-alpha-glucosidase
MRTELLMRFEYGYDVPWVRRTDRGLVAIAGPNALVLDSPIELTGIRMHHEGQFTVRAGDEVAFGLGWYQSHEDPPYVLDTARALEETVEFWEEWCDGIQQVHGEWQELALRSLITLKSLTYGPTGGIVAAATTSLPESIGGVRNWDYRYCWVRDAAFTLDALIESGLRDEAEGWLKWLGRVAAGDPEQLQIMYGPAGERRLTELEVDWLPGYERSAPVRIGNAASGQFQLDVYGELMDAVERARTHGIEVHEVIWKIQTAIMRFLVDHWSDPDDGIWEVRGPRRMFTHSKVMAWVAFDRALTLAEEGVLPKEPMDHWRQVRDEIHAEVCEKGFDPELNSFIQYYGSKLLDASLLMLAPVGFLRPDDPRIAGTVEAIQKGLVTDGLVRRYQTDTDEDVDGLNGTEGAFLMTSFWLADNLALLGRHDEAKEMFDRLCALCNDVGLLSEEYDPKARRLLGNFPQAFSHVALINTAANLSMAEHGPSMTRSRSYGDPGGPSTPAG